MSDDSEAQTTAGPATPVDITIRPACRNCGATLTGRFCAVCGQKDVDLNITTLHFLHEVWHELLHVDGKLIPSVRLLLTSPGALTLEHYAGRRASYLSPMRLYLVFSIIFFAIAAITPGSDLRITVGAESGWNFSSKPVKRQSNPEALRKLGFESDEELRRVTSSAVMRWLPRMMFLLVPLFAVLTGLTVRRLHWNYPRHVNFALHLHATWFLLGAISKLSQAIPIEWLGSLVATLVTFAVPVYFVLALRKTYDLTIEGAIWRALVVGISYAVLLLMSITIIVLPLVLDKA